MRFGSSIVALALAIGVYGQPERGSEQAVFFSGEVAMKDGTRPPEPVLIQRVCKGIAQNETWTDSKGLFGFKVAAGAGDTATADSAQAPRNSDLSRPIGNSTVYSNPVTAALRDCEVQAVLAGYWSDHVSIAIKNTLDDTRIGRIILHPMTGGQALIVSATTLAAPPKATQAYENGLMAMREQKSDKAAKEFSKAVSIYPKFAIAWFQLGMLHQSRNELAEASEAWKQALHSDPKYARPYEGLNALAERQQNWADLEKYSREWIQLDAESFPAAYLYNAVANARLNRSEQAEASARKGVLLDKDRKIPRLNYVLGLLLLEKHEFAESAKCLRAYLESSPNAKDAAVVREQVAKLDAASAK